MTIASYCEESLITLLFVKSEILKDFLHKSNKRVKFLMADTSHRRESDRFRGKNFLVNECDESYRNTKSGYFKENT